MYASELSISITTYLLFPEPVLSVSIHLSPMSSIFTYIPDTYLYILDLFAFSYGVKKGRALTLLCSDLIAPSNLRLVALLGAFMINLLSPFRLAIL